MSNRQEKQKEALKKKIAEGTPKPDAGEGSAEVKDNKEKIQAALQDATKRGDYVKMAYYTRILQEIK